MSEPIKNTNADPGLDPELPEREMYCPVCDMVTTIFSYDAVGCFPNPKEIDDIIGPYCAACDRCSSYLLTIHPSPEAALDYWRDHCRRPGVVSSEF